VQNQPQKVAIFGERPFISAPDFSPRIIGKKGLQQA
jgi:hypothetical protein